MRDLMVEAQRISSTAQHASSPLTFITFLLLLTRGNRNQVNRKTLRLQRPSRVSVVHRTNTRTRTRYTPFPPPQNQLTTKHVFISFDTLIERARVGLGFPCRSCLLKVILSHFCSNTILQYYRTVEDVLRSNLLTHFLRSSLMGGSWGGGEVHKLNFFSEFLNFKKRRRGTDISVS